MKTIKELSDQVRQTAYDIHVYHGHGHLEKVYENALAHRLRKAGLDVKQQHPIKVYDEDGTLVGDYFADLLVEGILILELKTAKALAPEHEAQILGYLNSARLSTACLSTSAPTNSRSASLHGPRGNLEGRRQHRAFSDASSLRSLRSLRLGSCEALLAALELLQQILRLGILRVQLQERLGQEHRIIRAFDLHQEVRVAVEGLGADGAEGKGLAES